ncbi:carboxylesterase family domain-containing protein [Phthorimaea operculella]|nr:carboxylesterase family domain-containing protein [Phthorimaea operculella]
MWLERLCGVLAIGCVLAQRNEYSRTVQIDQGPVRGYRYASEGIFAFYNIPYATAPTGKDRFKAPLPPPVWITPREGLDRGVICPQMDLSFLGIRNKIMQEDCLIANVYVPDTDETNLPVVVLIHGGAFLIGYGDISTPKHMVREQKIIYVTFNYRLGIHGFLCLGTPDVPGNAGMKDMVALLRWVNRNIESFGGNPNDVTLEGWSAGSVAVELLMLSKAARGLFHKAIPESGSSFVPYSVAVDPVGNAKDFARTDLGFKDVDNISALEELYKTVPFKAMYKQGPLILFRHIFPFTPCVERNTGQDVFLDDAPYNILKNGDYMKVPMLYGVSNKEGLYRVDYGYQFFIEGMNRKFSDYLPIDLQFKDEDEKEEVAKMIKEYYFGNRKIDEDTIFEYIDYFTDSMFAYPHLKEVQLQVEASNNQVYLYQFSYPYENKVPEGVNVKVIGSNHCGETLTVLDNWLGAAEIPAERNSDLEQVRNVTRQIWGTFIKTGKPTREGSNLPAWPATDRSGAPYMVITNQPELKRQPLLSMSLILWNNIYQRHYRVPRAPQAPPVKAEGPVSVQSRGALPQRMHQTSASLHQFAPAPPQATSSNPIAHFFSNFLHKFTGASAS